MLTAMIRKEVRELLPLTVFALLVQFFLITVETGVDWQPLTSWLNSNPYRGRIIPFVSPTSCFYNFVATGVWAVTLGLWQTMWESSRGTFLLLLHRPVRRETIIGAKLLVGGLLCLLAGGLPLLCYAIWAAIPGTHASPFEWSMTGWAWQSCVVLILLYLGAFLSGLRSARWYVSRFWPVATALLVVAILNTTPSSTIWWWIELVFVVLVGGGLLLAILHVARSRDYS
jgi:ABC-type transport system involved in multi-copper enzyme maturation permease subunit